MITGLGIVSSIGIGAPIFWTRLLEGANGISPITSIDSSPFRARLGGEVVDFDLANHSFPTTHQRMGRASQMALAASQLALRDARLPDSEVRGPHSGVVIGTTSGEPRLAESYVDRRREGHPIPMTGDFLNNYPCHHIAGHIAAHFECSAFTPLVIPTACAAGNYAIAHGLDRLEAGEADLILAGGSDSFSRLTFTGFSRLLAIAPDRCQPFDLHRKGMIPGEGAAVLVLETYDRARARKAPIYAEVAGYGLSCDAHHITAGHPQGDGAVRAMTQALNHSGFGPEEISYISAHGTGTKANDLHEAIAVERVFGPRASKVPISSIKSMLGHTMGAASALEAAACALAIRDDRIPPTMHFTTPDPAIPLDCVPNRARDITVKAAMNNAYAFGGANASVIFKKPGLRGTSS